MLAEAIACELAVLAFVYVGSQWSERMTLL